MKEKFIPNSFQIPNAYVDELMYLLTPHEWVVLSYAARRIFGFQKRQDRIALSQFEKGVTARDGTQLDHGTGLNRAQIIKAIECLTLYGILILVKENEGRQGNQYALQLDEHKIDFVGLLRRAEEQADEGRKRSAKARAKRGLAVSPTNREIKSRGMSDRDFEVSQTNHLINLEVSPTEVSRLVGLTHMYTGNTVKERNTGNKGTDGANAPAHTPPLYIIASALAEVTGMDFQKNKARLFKEAKSFYKPEDIEPLKEKYGPGGPWYLYDWRGKKGERPTLPQIRETWGSLTAGQPARRSLFD